MQYPVQEAVIILSGAPKDSTGKEALESQPLLEEGFLLTPSEKKIWMCYNLIYLIYQCIGSSSTDDAFFLLRSQQTDRSVYEGMVHITDLHSTILVSSYTWQLLYSSLTIYQMCCVVMKRGGILLWLTHY